MKRNAGFTMFELVIVLTMLLLVAGLAVPQYLSTESELAEEALVMDLKVVRTAIEQYAKDHGDRLPGIRDGVMSEAAFLSDLMNITNAQGVEVLEGGFGPYLPAGLPPNPINGRDTVWFVEEGDVPDPDGRTGWILHAPTRRFFVNTRELSSNGSPLSLL